MRSFAFSVLCAFAVALALGASLLAKPPIPLQGGGLPGNPPLIPLDILINGSDLMAIPTTGAEWANIVTWSDHTTEAADPGGNDSNHDVVALAAALRGKRTTDTFYVNKTRDYIAAVIVPTIIGFTTPPTIPHPTIDVLAIGRNVLPYVLAADLINLDAVDPGVDEAFRDWLGDIKTQTWQCGRTLQGIHELRPNNEGLVAGATRIAIDMYLGTFNALDDIKEAQKVFHAWLGNVTLHSGFEYGGGNPPPPQDNSWQVTTNPALFRGINPAGSMLGTHPAGGLLPDDQRRLNEAACCNTNPSYPACWGMKTNYVWEALQGAVMQAHLLARCGYSPFSWESAALDRAITWLYDVYSFPPEDTLSSLGTCNSGNVSDDTWIVHITDKYYGTSRATTFGGQPGKNCGFADWWSKGI